MAGVEASPGLWGDGRSAAVSVCVCIGRQEVAVGGPGVGAVAQARAGVDVEVLGEAVGFARGPKRALISSAWWWLMAASGCGRPRAPKGKGGMGQRMPWRRQIWFFLLVSALSGSQSHWWIFVPAAVEIPLTSTHLPLWTAASW
jgi:hypothetical protein